MLSASVVYCILNFPVERFLFALNSGLTFAACLNQFILYLHILLFGHHVHFWDLLFKLNYKEWCWCKPSLSVCLILHKYLQPEDRCYTKTKKKKIPPKLTARLSVALLWSSCCSLCSHCRIPLLLPGAGGKALEALQSIAEVCGAAYSIWGASPRVHCEALRGADKLAVFLGLLYRTIIVKTPKIPFHRNTLLFVIDVLPSKTFYVHRWHRKQDMHILFCVRYFVNAVGKLLCVHTDSTEWNDKT